MSRPWDKHDDEIALLDLHMPLKGHGRDEYRDMSINSAPKRQRKKQRRQGIKVRPNQKGRTGSFAHLQVFIDNIC